MDYKKKYIKYKTKYLASKGGSINFEKKDNDYVIYNDVPNKIFYKNEEKIANVLIFTERQKNTILYVIDNIFSGLKDLVKNPTAEPAEPDDPFDFFGFNKKNSDIPSKYSNIKNDVTVLSYGGVGIILIIHDYCIKIIKTDGDSTNFDFIEKYFNKSKVNYPEQINGYYGHISIINGDLNNTISDKYLSSIDTNKKNYIMENNLGNLHFLLIEKGGKDLSSYLTDTSITKQIRQNNIYKFLFDMQDALSYFHANYIVHSDIKPQNILFNSDKTMFQIIDYDSAYVNKIYSDGMATACTQAYAESYGAMRNYTCYVDILYDWYCIYIIFLNFIDTCRDDKYWLVTENCETIQSGGANDFPIDLKNYIKNILFNEIYFYLSNNFQKSLETNMDEQFDKYEKFKMNNFVSSQIDQKNTSSVVREVQQNKKPVSNTSFNELRNMYENNVDDGPQVNNFISEIKNNAAVYKNDCTKYGRSIDNTYGPLNKLCDDALMEVYNFLRKIEDDLHKFYNSNGTYKINTEQTKIPNQILTMLGNIKEVQNVTPFINVVSVFQLIKYKIISTNKSLTDNPSKENKQMIKILHIVIKNSIINYYINQLRITINKSK